jgi:hypothetical protein
MESHVNNDEIAPGTRRDLYASTIAPTGADGTPTGRSPVIKINLRD